MGVKYKCKTCGLDEYQNGCNTCPECQAFWAGVEWEKDQGAVVVWESDDARLDLGSHGPYVEFASEILDGRISVRCKGRQVFFNIDPCVHTRDYDKDGRPKKDIPEGGYLCLNIGGMDEALAYLVDGRMKGEDLELCARYLLTKAARLNGDG